MTKAKKIERMREMLDDLRPYIEESGLKANYLVLAPEITKLPASFIDEGFKWLDAIWRLNYQNLRYINGLLKPEIWERYRLWGDFEEHREMKMRIEALRKLRKEICTRNGKPGLFIKGQRDLAIKKAAKK